MMQSTKLEAFRLEFLQGAGKNPIGIKYLKEVKMGLSKFNVITTKMGRLYVRFAGDNDFSTTVKAFVEAIAPRVLLGEWGDITKEEIVKLFNDSAYVLYTLHQKHNLKIDSSDLTTYLMITVKDIYFDDEVDNFTNYNGDGCLAVLEYDKIAYYIM
jgi:hypothetical protein